MRGEEQSRREQAARSEASGKRDQGGAPPGEEGKSRPLYWEREVLPRAGGKVWGRGGGKVAPLGTFSSHPGCATASQKTMNK